MNKVRGGELWWIERKINASRWVLCNDNSHTWVEGGHPVFDKQEPPEEYIPLPVPWYKSIFKKFGKKFGAAKLPEAKIHEAK